MKKFEIGKEYFDRSACNHDCIFTIKIIKRTDCPYQVGDDDLEEVEVLSVSDLYLMWQELKAGDKSCGENCWKYHFYRHEIKPEHDERTGKPIFIDYVTPGKVYRRGNKVFFKEISE